MEDFILDKFTEAELEKAIISLFEDEGYEFTNGEFLHRKLSDVLIGEDLVEFLHTKYFSDNLSDSEIKRIIATIENISSTPLYDGNKESWKNIAEGFTFLRDDSSKQAIHINLIDFENSQKNIFKIINQFSVEDKRIRRPDLLVFINGIPISIFEFKTAIEEDTTIFDAYEQIHKRYKRDIPSLLKYSFLSVISDGVNTKMGSIFTPYHFYYSWNKVNDDETITSGITSLYSMIKGVFSKERILEILRDFIFYPDNSDKEEAIVSRYPQYFATVKMFENIKQHIKPKGDGKGGTYFGATGSGKTYTMLYLTRKLMLRDSDTFKNPTIIIITDREDLDTQTSKIFVNATEFLHENDVRSIESRDDLGKTLEDKPSGGIYLTTIQKFSESTGLLSNRENIICISDEAHRTQTGIGAKLKKTEEGVFTTYGFAKYLRDSFPNATYCGFTGTPIDETIAVFGDVVDKYTMKESSDDGITVRIAYEPRLARVLLSEKNAKEIEEYYNFCVSEGASEYHVEKSKKEMSSVRHILGHRERLERLALDMISHYEKLCNENPKVVKKAMIVCSDRRIAFDLLNIIYSFRPEWKTKKKTEDDSKYSEEELNKLIALPKINLVATQGENDDEDLYEACGTREYRKLLDKQFKDDNSNFKIAIVVDMWITGFDVPSLAVMYIDKPLQKHTLIQTISRVNRVFEGKDRGLVVDYIGIKNDMLEAIKMYGQIDETPVDEIGISISIFRNHLKLIDDLLINFDSSKFFLGTPIERLECLNRASDYIQMVKEVETRFMNLSRKMKSAYEICYPSGELSDGELNKAQYYIAVRSIIYKQTRPHMPDTEMMNSVVYEMVQNALTFTGIENIVNANDSEDIFGDNFIKEVEKIKSPISKFNALLKLLKRSVNQYMKTNKTKALEFDERLKIVVEKYNNRDKLVFTSEVVGDFIDELSDELIKLLQDMQEDKTSFEKMGITFEEKAFFDILVKVRDTHKFKYEDEKCIVLAKKIKELVDDKSQFADWSTRDDIKNQLNMDLTVLLYKNGYPPEWDEEVFEKVMEQAENFKKYS